MSKQKKYVDGAFDPGRRKLIQFAGAGAAALFLSKLTGCGGGASATPTTSAPATTSTASATGSASGPEVTNLKLGIIALTDCSPIVIAHEKGFFKKYGLNVTVDKKASWRSIYDSLANGDIQGTHMLIGMPIASTLGMIGPPLPMVAPWLLNRNGQSISLKKDFKGKVAADAKLLKPFADAARDAKKPLSCAVTFPQGTHAMWMRYWLASGGINPDTDVSLSVVPPASMFANMEAGAQDVTCVGEPWNAKMVKEKVGFTALNSQDLWADHPEKVLAFTEKFANENPKTVKAVCKALHEASVWLDNMDNRAEQCKIIAATNYVNCPVDSILPRMMGKYDFGDGRTTDYDKTYMIFSQRNCNYPQAKYALWFLSQFRRWGMLKTAPDYAAVAKQVMRADLYEEAMKELGYAHGGADMSPEKLFDGTFDPAKPEEYARSFAINKMA